ncbi:hypothetical protein N2382_01735 [SAR92 clade bacterium H921]|nr:hypothetical protein [SAR92 clade bacterium H921]
MNSKSLRFLISTCIIWLCSTSAFSACDFDTDDADSPDFVDKIIECDESKNKPSRPVLNRVLGKAEYKNTTRLYGDGTKDPASGIFERPVVAPGSMNHSPNKMFASRQAFSLRPNAKFEQSVTLAIQRLYIEMAHYCAKGWSIEDQWSEPDPAQEGDYFLHYRYTCAG